MSELSAHCCIVCLFNLVLLPIAPMLAIRRVAANPKWEQLKISRYFPKFISVLFHTLQFGGSWSFFLETTYFRNRASLVEEI